MCSSDQHEVASLLKSLTVSGMFKGSVHVVFRVSVCSSNCQLVLQNCQYGVQIVSVI